MTAPNILKNNYETIFLNWTDYTSIVLANDLLNLNNGQHVRHGIILYFNNEVLVLENWDSINISREKYCYFNLNIKWVILIIKMDS